LKLLSNPGDFQHLLQLSAPIRELQSPNNQLWKVTSLTGTEAPLGAKHQYIFSLQ